MGLHMIEQTAHSFIYIIDFAKTEVGERITFFYKIFQLAYC